jgi:hypothetical protein
MSGGGVDEVAIWVGLICGYCGFEGRDLDIVGVGFEGVGYYPRAGQVKIISGLVGR